MEKVIPISTERAMSLCAHSLDDDAVIIEQDLNNQQAQAFMIGECCFIVRTESIGEHKELVIMCAEGKGAIEAINTLTHVAKLNGCTSARFHTKRPILQRLAKRLGWLQHEVVFKKSI